MRRWRVEWRRPEGGLDSRDQARNGVAAASTSSLVIGSSNAPSQLFLPPILRTMAAWRASTEWICSAA